jgi:hypothetical protein
MRSLYIRAKENQGMSLSRAVLNFNDSEFALGLSYVTVSPVKTFGGLMFESAFEDFRRIKWTVDQWTRLCLTWRRRTSPLGLLT